MSGRYFIGAADGSHWSFTAAELAQAAAELRPAAQVSGPVNGEVDIEIPGQPWAHTITYSERHAPVFSFKEDDGVPAMAGTVLELLQLLAPDAQAMCLADFGIEHTFRPTDTTVQEFVREIWGEP